MARCGHFLLRLRVFLLWLLINNCGLIWTVFNLICWPVNDTKYNALEPVYESSQQRYANLPTKTWLARHFETDKFPITSSPRARPSNWANAELYRYKIVAVSLHKTHICVVKSLVKIAAVSWHSLRRFIKPAPVSKWGLRDVMAVDESVVIRVLFGSFDLR